jgi:hypothetical protein
MSKLKGLISRYDQRLSEASSLSDREAVLNILTEYRESVEALKDCSEAIREELDVIVNKNGRARIDLLLSAAYIHPDLSYVDSLCALLALRDPKLPNEQIVDILRKIPSPKSVPYLKTAVLVTFSYDAYDEFGVKCLDALAATNTPMHGLRLKLH